MTFLGLLLALALGGGGAAHAATTPQAELLRLPFPYRAAVTICSDSHKGSVEQFEAVHTLVNTEAWIEKDSPTWRLLFADPAIEREPSWSGGIRGFGLPVGDSVWLYGSEIAVFERFDPEAERAVAHAHVDGRDQREIVDSWIRRGWVDTLHTAGEGDLPREALRQGLDWLAESPQRRLGVWVNHALHRAPNGIQPNVDPLLPLVLGNLARSPAWLLARLGAGAPARRLFDRPAPLPFPPGQRLLPWILSVLLVSSVGFGLIGLSVPRWRRGWVPLACALVLATTIAILHVIPHRYAQGDDPGSRYYNADLVRKAGFRFFWMVGAGYPFVVSERLALPETDWGERRSFLHPVELDDGSTVLAFPRASAREEGGLRSLELLTEAGLAELADVGGASILYTHWLNGTQQVFSAAGLRSLERLRRAYREGVVWVAPTGELLRFELVRTFLDFEARIEQGTLVIEIGRVRDPVAGPFWPSPEDLRGISFSTQSPLPIELRLGNTSLGVERFDVIEAGASRIVTFPASG